MATLEQEIKQSKFESEQIKANLNILFTANWLTNKLSARLKPYNLTHEQFNVLRILRGSHPTSMCQKDILSRMLAPSSNLTLIVKKLTDKKLIQVLQSDEDKREYKINITNDGLALLDVISEDYRSQSVILNKLSESEAFHLNALLEKLRQE
jgi:DNA-binding MarR family transcriptional regulator